jgi:hypothetical protein
MYHQHNKFEEHGTVLDARTRTSSRPRCVRTEGNIMSMAQVVMKNLHRWKNSVFDYVLTVEMCNGTTSDFKIGKFFL